MACKARTCPICGALWGMDTRKKLLVNVQAYGGAVSLVTVTAPGRDLLPFREGTHEVERAIARRWNRQARAEWRRIHRKATQKAKRHARRHGFEWGVIARAWAFQRRGVLHLHVIVPMERAIDRICSQIYAEALASMAEAHGFGYVDRGRKTRAGTTWSRRLLEVVHQERAARYLAKYVAKHTEVGLELHATALHPDAPGQIVYVSRELVSRTGISMRYLRSRRIAFNIAAAWKMPYDELLELLAEGAVISGYENALAPLRGP